MRWWDLKSASELGVEKDAGVKGEYGSAGGSSRGAGEMQICGMGDARESMVDMKERNTS